MADICIAFATSVRPRQEAVQCDGCNKWQHRTCNTGISRADYRTAVQSGADLDWLCFQCSLVPCTSSWVEEPYSVSEPSASTILGEITDPEPTLLEAESTVYDPPAANAEWPSFLEPTLPSAANAEELSLPEPTLLEAESTAVSPVEPSIAEPHPLVENARQDPVTYEIESTNKGKRKLIDSNGYSYNVKRQRPNATDWQCIVRPKVNSLLCFIMISYSILRKSLFKVFTSEEAVSF